MSDFKAKMHQIQFRLGLRPISRWGSLQRSPNPHSSIIGGLLLREERVRAGNGRGKGRGEEEKKGEGKERRETDGGRRMEGRLPR